VALTAWLLCTQLPKVMELVGLGYTSWFIYRYVLFQDGRKDLGEDIEVCLL
jgi:hypothetical protein